MAMFEPTIMFEFDVFWATIDGFAPIELMKKLKGRVSQVLLKDIKRGTEPQWDEGKVPKDAFQELGDGEIDMIEVMKVAKEIGVVQCHVEQDQLPEPLESIAQCFRYLTSIDSPQPGS
jgi:sugar phosphate isomerase/epimerase